MEKFMPCPFCGKVPKIIVLDGEGNIRDECYEQDPWSGIGYVIDHCVDDDEDDNTVCPIATFPHESIGTQMYDSKEEAIERWNRRTKTIDSTQEKAEKEFNEAKARCTKRKS